MRYRITFKPPKKSWEGVIYQDFNKAETDKEDSSIQGKAGSMYTRSAKIKKELTNAGIKGEFVLVRIEEVPQK